MAQVVPKYTLLSMRDDVVPEYQGSLTEFSVSMLNGIKSVYSISNIRSAYLTVYGVGELHIIAVVYDMEPTTYLFSNVRDSCNGSPSS